jgi:hypothetical protein
LQFSSYQSVLYLKNATLIRGVFICAVNIAGFAVADSVYIYVLSLTEQTKEIYRVNEYWRYIIQGVARGCYSFQFPVLLNWVECKKQNCGILFK